jgi:hypothetical protein
VSNRAGDGFTLTHEKPRGGCADSLETLLTGEWQKRAVLKDKLLAIGYGRVSKLSAHPPQPIKHVDGYKLPALLYCVYRATAVSCHL